VGTGFLNGMKGLFSDEDRTVGNDVDLQAEIEHPPLFNLRTSEEWERLEQYKEGEIDRYGNDVIHGTDPGLLYEPPGEDY
jgi:hypothetical protein